MTIEKHEVNYLDIYPVPGDLSLSVKGEGENVNGICGQYVCDSLNAENKSFETNTEQTLNFFMSIWRSFDYFQFFGTQICTTEMSEFFVWQQCYVNNLTHVSHNVSFDDFYRHWALFSWTGQGHPYLMFHANRAAQVSEKQFAEKYSRA